LWTRIFGVLQLAFYAVAAAGLLGGEQLRGVRPIGAASYFCVANAAAFVAAIHYMTGRRYAQWKTSDSAR
jgi:hypothetical protein